MTKRNLHSGMIVKLRNNGLYMVMLNTGTEKTDFSDKDILLGINSVGDFVRGWLRLSNYDDELRFYTSPEDLIKYRKFYDKDMDREYDIMKVYTCSKSAYIGLVNKYRLLYERK